MAAAVAPLDFGASDFAEVSAFISLEDGEAEDGEAFMSLEDDEGGGVVALGLEAGGDALGAEPEGGEEYDDCARADDSISPLSAVVTNNFLSIENLHDCGCFGWRICRARLFVAVRKKPALFTPTFEYAGCSAIIPAMRLGRGQVVKTTCSAARLPPEPCGSCKFDLNLRLLNLSLRLTGINSDRKSRVRPGTYRLCIAADHN